VPDRVINNLARVVGIDVQDEDAMDTSDAPPPKGFDPVQTKVKELMREGYSATQILMQLHDLVILHPSLDGKQKSQCALVFAEADKALCDGADEELWILEVALRVYKLLS